MIGPGAPPREALGLDILAIVDGLAMHVVPPEAAGLPNALDVERRVIARL
jgi:hypothetical protein